VVPNPVHLIPLYEYAKLFVPSPVATHIEPLQAIPLQLVLNMVVPNPIHDIPSFEYANVFPTLADGPLPPAT